MGNRKKTENAGFLRFLLQMVSKFMSTCYAQCSPQGAKKGVCIILWIMWITLKSSAGMRGMRSGKVVYKNIGKVNRMLWYFCLFER